ncbi:M1 family metallopeptidase [Shewanella nanhaiensis]|uniref:ERAP1-like C-terminal domain-containing protein n=1 Tax=Shewanella nanhaiensis TaxID=2864872 RepID=A0ABS7E1D0_9GAMM|nr:M1 family metallopeptidase [Shewanella nanhaiensis]MBW8183355.1 ERAP1-like C-terminal domain-containing protein [Shewanella nanhaiensis]
MIRTLTLDLLRVCLSSLLSLALFFSVAISPKAETKKAIIESRVSELSYQVSLSLSDKPELNVVSKINFRLIESEQPLTLALRQAQVSSFIINGHKIYPNYDGEQFTLSPRLLENGSNTLEINYRVALTTEKSGMSRVIDRLDQHIYLYSNFDEESVSQLLPIFNQGNKASFQFNITAPKSWTIITTQAETELISKGEFNLWQFPPSPELTPYQLPLYAGPFQIWHNTTTELPLRLIARQSVKDAIDSELWFSNAHNALTKFTQQYGQPYPNDKLDLIIKPSPLATSSKIGVGSFNERDLTPSDEDKFAQQSLTSQIDYQVSMQWLNTLNVVEQSEAGELARSSLRESLASYMAIQAQADTGEYSPIWHQFFLNQKQIAYEQDELYALPLAGKAPAMSPFKGAAILKQLEYQFTSRHFRQTLTELLDSQNGSLTLADFINKLAADEKPPHNQSQDKTQLQAIAGHIKVDFSCADKRINSFTVLQSPASGMSKELNNKLDTQRVTLGLYTKGRRQLHRNLDAAITYQGAETQINRLIGVRCPDLVYPNDHDWGYVKVELDPKSMDTAKLELSTLEDPLLKSMLWQTLWESVLDGKLPLDQFLGAVFINLPQEQNPEVLAQVLKLLIKSKTYLEQMQPMHLSYTRSALKGMAQMSLRKTMFYNQNPALQKQWFNAYIQLATNTQALDHLQQLIEGSAHINGLVLTQAMRWSIVKQINRYDHIKAKKLLLTEQKNDDSETGKLSFIAAQASRPEANIKRRWLTRIQSDERIAPAIIEQVIPNLYPKEQAELSAMTAELRLTKLNELNSRKTPEFMDLYAKHLIPAQCNYRGIETLEKVLKEYVNFPLTALQKRKLSKTSQEALLSAYQDEVRCVRIKERLLH